MSKHALQDLVESASKMLPNPSFEHNDRGHYGTTFTH
jgi:hypothetical protein